MRRTFLTSLLAATALTSTGAALAQETETEDTITVTGSRIARDPNLVSSTPVQSITSEDIRLSGEINIADVINDIPALVSSLTSENSVTGANQLNLRGLGADRSLTLVNGRRHVAGFRGSQSVDIGSIPRALVESVEVTTGGASAIYGADAVTGVINFILKEDFEGFEINTSGGISSEGDAGTFVFDAIAGKNFHDGRGNVVFTVSYEDDNNITYGDRSWSRDNGIASVGPDQNPLRRFQNSDFVGADLPNFGNRFAGDLIPTDPDDLAGLNLSPAEQALVDRAAAAPLRAVIENPVFWLTSQAGSIAPTFFGREDTYVDINGNGIADCQESRGGRDPFLAGCWVTNPDGSVSVFEDDLIVSGGLWGSGGDGGALNFNRDTLFPENDRWAINLNSTYDLTETVKVFFEGKYVLSEATSFGEQDTFYDTLFIQADNPFIPDELQPVVDQTGGLLLTQDPLDFSDNNPTTVERETIRFVGGMDWEFADGHTLTLSANYGKFTNTTEETTLYLDRVFAALDVTTDANGNPVCRSDLDPTAAYEIDFFTASNGFADGAFSSDRYYSFTPGDGQCQPLNPFGTYSASEAAQNFVTAPIKSTLEVEQTVLAAIATGEVFEDTRFLDGAIGYAVGIEYREESSDDRLDPLELGILPEGTSFTPGVQVSEVDSFLFSFTDIDNSQQFNTSGEYDVVDVFGEVILPILQDKPFAKELTIDGAIRYADYSTIGGATTWKVGGTWAPVSDLSFRATVSEAVRAPNISELFDPPLPITIAATADPCDPGNINGGSSSREANCIASLQAAGVPLTDIVDGNGAYIWNNPLTGRFAGTSGGNPDLSEETAETLTFGAVIAPSFIENLTLTIDYWDIEISEAISDVDATDILSGCLDSEDFPNVPFCGSFQRRADGGLTDLQSGQINFARLEASGIDFAANYSLDLGANTFDFGLVGSYQEALDRFFNPTDLTEVNPDLGEVRIPELSGNVRASWSRGPLNVGVQMLYQDRQAVDDIDGFAAIDSQERYGAGAFFDETYILDVNANYEVNDRLTVYGGVNNLTDEEPFATQTAWPVGPRGRFFFLGLTYTQ
ncbi:MAG: TonB-dependent receptor [Pseudomonadota bacterium]